MKYQGSVSELKTREGITTFVLHVTGGPDVRVQTSLPLPAGTRVGDLVQIEGAETNDPPFIATAIQKVGTADPKPVPWKLIAAGIVALVLLILLVYAVTHKSTKTKHFTLQMKETSQFLASTDCGSSVGLQASSTEPTADCAAWSFVPDPTNTGYMRIQLKKNGLYLTMPNCGNPALLSPSVSGANQDCQLWRFSPVTSQNTVPANGAWTKLQSKYKNYFLDAIYCESKFGLNPGSTYHDGACELFLVNPAS